MRIDPAVLATILGMAVVTYLTRAGGLVLMSRLKLPSRAQAGLAYIPGSILVAIVAPSVLAATPAEAVAALATLLVAIRTRNLVLAMATGVTAVVALRHFIPK